MTNTVLITGAVFSTGEWIQYGSVSRSNEDNRPLNPPILGDFPGSPRIGGWGAYPNRIESGFLKP